MTHQPLIDSLKDLEEKSGLKRSVIVKGIGIAPQTYANWIQGLCDVKTCDLIKICKFYKTKPNKLLKL